MSFDLAVLAMDDAADATTVRAKFARCTAGVHAEGDLDARIVGFHERLRHRFPDHPGRPVDSPWASTPLAAGIDHVVVQLRHSVAGDEAVAVMKDLAAEFGLVLWDPQTQEAWFPPAG
ncbi:hypothetical protein LX16_0597 [Stackebrandtia albiflava]|uniref:Uncharacterized protein n=1 Tax=Stackebrandtia albiflava TaxID=406432 RepID=A0A562VAL6_9ACTN|nr:hypothetical protein [Stackebrandtia albiflava]TWJ14904.1 hypothetical protein LX16_0597 [Stackebrandtia albiflava]